MQYSNTTSKNGVIQNIESLCNLGDGGITGNTTLFAKVTGYVNQVNKQIASALMQCDKAWEFDDFNNTDLPRGTTTLVSGQRDYTLPVAVTSADASTLLGVEKISVLNSNGDEHVLHLSTEPDAVLNVAYENSGLPTVYKLIGNTVKIWPAADNGVSVTLAAGLVCYFKRTPVEFTTSSTTVQPGFMSSFHDLLELGASAKYLMPINNDLALQYLGLFNAKLEQLQEAYVRSNGDSKNRIVLRHRSSR